jgi:hypothetical protein
MNELKENYDGYPLTFPDFFWSRDYKFWSFWLLNYGLPIGLLCWNIVYLGIFYLKFKRQWVFFSETLKLKSRLVIFFLSNNCNA